MWSAIVEGFKILSDFLRWATSGPDVQVDVKPGEFRPHLWKPDQGSIRRIGTPSTEIQIPGMIGNYGTEETSVTEIILSCEVAEDFEGVRLDWLSLNEESKEFPVPLETKQEHKILLRAKVQHENIPLHLLQEESISGKVRVRIPGETIVKPVELENAKLIRKGQKE